MKKIILIFLFSIQYFNINAQNSSAFIGDLIIQYSGLINETITATIEIVTIPFEGKTEAVNSHYRFDTIQNGSVHRIFSPTTGASTDYGIVYHSVTRVNPGDPQYGNIIDLGHCANVEIDNGAGSLDGGWGFGKYKLSIEVSSTGEKYVCYLNCSDSKYGKNFFQGQTIYGNDWVLEFIGNRPINDGRVIFRSGPPVSIHWDTIKTTDTLAGGIPSKEFKVWELIYNRSEPWSEEFYARSSPFPVSVDVAQNFGRLFSIGTKVILDTVLQNLGNSDRLGYNTQNDPYYSNQNPVILPFGSPGNTYVTPGKLNLATDIYGIKIIAEAGDSIILKKNKRLWIYGAGTAPDQGGDTLLLKPGSYLQLDTNAEIFTLNGGVFIDSGSNRSWKHLSCHRAFEGTSVNFFGNSHAVNNGGFIVIDGNATLKLGDSATLTFDGSTSYLNLKSSSQVKLGHNSKIVFKNGAYLRANGATFSQTSSGKISGGLVFENSGLDSIVNCTFSNAKTSITIKNDSISFANANNNIIKGNTFNISQTNGIGIYANNVLNMLVYNNDFICSNSTSQFGIYFRNNSNFNGASSYSLNILYNTFENGYLPLFLSCLAADRTPFYIVQNFFFGDNLYSMDLVKISGDVKYNTFDVYNYNRSIGLWNSSPNFFNNIIESRDFNMYLSHSFPKMSALRTEDDKIMWESGKNIFNSEAGENMVLSGSYPAIDYGKNRFQIMSSTPYHLVGELMDTNIFRMRFNCWGGHYDSAKYYLYTYVNSIVHPISAIYLPKFCTYPIIETAPSAVITDKGNGVYDTTIVSDDNFAFLIEDDEALLIQARSDFRRHFYPEAVTNYKGLIDNYNSSMYLYTALNELYDCYSELDTASDPEETDILFGDLKEYLEEKINSEEYDNTFNETAYDFLLICETRMEDYEIALTGYEFLAMYHPDAEQRIIASWDYEDIEYLYGGEGGGGRSNKDYLPRYQADELQNEELKILREYKRLNKIIRDDPVMGKLKKGWDNESKKKKERQLKENNTDKIISSHAKVNPIQTDKLISRAKENILRAKYLPKEEKEKRRMEDIVLLVGNGNTDTQTDKVTTSIPEVYELIQNYPNPFNPTTTISYQLPKAGLVSITVYDITGKEVAKLVNEFKEAGSYDITFTASNLSSGIYFYSLRADGFTDTKKMVVIK